MAMKKSDIGQWEDPDLVPIMNLVCVLIPLVLYSATWITFGEITVLRGSSSEAGRANQASQETKKLRLVAVLTKGSITLMANRELAGTVMPPDPTTGTSGRVDIPHISVRTTDIENNMQTSCPSPPEAKFDDCKFWGYVAKWTEICYERPQGQIKIPDLRTFNLTLRRIKELAVQNYDQIEDINMMNIKSEDDIPYCELVGLMDFARMVNFDYDWTTDTEFMDAVNAAVRKGVTDPFLSPADWNEAMEKQLLFPIIGFVN